MGNQQKGGRPSPLKNRYSGNHKNGNNNGGKNPNQNKLRQQNSNNGGPSKQNIQQQAPPNNGNNAQKNFGISIPSHIYNGPKPQNNQNPYPSQQQRKPVQNVQKQSQPKLALNNYPSKPETGGGQIMRPPTRQQKQQRKAQKAALRAQKNAFSNPKPKPIMHQNLCGML